MSLANEPVLVADDELTLVLADELDGLCELVRVRIAFIHLLFIPEPLLPPWPALPAVPPLLAPETLLERLIEDCSVPPVSAMIASAFEPYKSRCTNNAFTYDNRKSMSQSEHCL